MTGQFLYRSRVSGAEPPAILEYERRAWAGPDELSRPFYVARRTRVAGARLLVFALAAG